VEFAQTWVVDAPPAVVAAVLRDEAFNLDLATSRDDVVRAEWRSIEHTDEHHAYEVHTTEYGRTLTGGIDRADVKQSTTRYRWRASAGTIEWTWEGRESGRVEVAGTMTIRERGSGTEVVNQRRIEVRVPLIGERIAKLIAREFTKSSDGQLAVLREHVRRRLHDAG